MKTKAAVAWKAGARSRSKPAPFDHLIRHTMPLENINKGFDPMKRGESIRSVVMH